MPLPLTIPDGMRIAIKLLSSPWVGSMLVGAVVVADTGVELLMELGPLPISACMMAFQFLCVISQRIPMRATARVTPTCVLLLDRV
jgi:hypothetical protein